MIYTIQNHPHLYTLIKCSLSAEGEPLATFTPFTRHGEEITIPALWSSEYHGDGTDSVEKLAIKSIRAFRTDEARTHRAALIMRYNNPANNEDDFIYTTSRGEIEIKSRADGKRYKVTTKSCECPDSQRRGKICKHRIAAWMHQQLHGEQQHIPAFFEFHYCLDCNAHHWLEINAGEEICHGKNYDPRQNLRPGTRIKERNFSSARQAASIEIMQP